MIKRPTRRELLEAACAAARHAHAPYSRFPVGAALLTDDGTVFVGCNIENASFGLTICAERVALSAAVAAGHRHFHTLAVVAGTSQPAMPCGACRQVLAEFCGPSLAIVIAPHNHLNRARRTTLGHLLPDVFRLSPR